ncbi:MAG: hypothetical protein Q7R88_00095 [bacterium]|nr:hypothetical protein [bacterium]
MQTSIKKSLLLILLLALLASVLYAFGKSRLAEQVPLEAEDTGVPVQQEQINFVREGILEFATSTGQDIPYFSYPNFGGPTTTMELLLNEESMCATPTGSAPCMTMSALYHIPFGGKRARVEAVEKEARVLVRQIVILE